MYLNHLSGNYCLCLKNELLTINKITMALHIIDHPLVLHKLSIMRNKETSTSQFRKLLYEISLFRGYEITRDFPLEYEEIETPLMKMNAPKISGKKVVIAPILRAGLGMVDGLTSAAMSGRVERNAFSSASGILPSTQFTRS